MTFGTPYAHLSHHFDHNLGLSQHVSGVILFEETLNEITADGKTPFIDILKKGGFIIGIKVDKVCLEQQTSDNHHSQMIQIKLQSFVSVFVNSLDFFVLDSLCGVG